MMSVVTRDWTDLLPELLALIASKLHPFDCSQFRAASPAFAAACAVPVLAPKAPFLLFPGLPGESSTFLCVAEDTHYRARLPYLDGRYCVGSQDGWLVTLDAFCEPALLNPVTGQEVKLPSMATLPFIRHGHGPDGSITSIFHRSDDEWYETTPRNYAGLAIERAVLSCSPNGDEGGFIIAALLGAPRKMIWTRSGEDRWHIPESPGFLFREVGFHKGQLFGVGAPGFYHVCLDGGAPAVAELICEDVGRWMGDRHIYLFTDHESGELMLAWRYYYYDGIRARTTSIDIVRFDAERRAWVAVQGLGNHALFVGIGTPVLVSAAEDEGVEANCVYFNDDWWDLMFADEHRAGAERDVGIYHLGDGSMERFQYPPHPRYNWPAPVWISTMLPVGLDNFEVEREELMEVISAAY